MKRFLLDKITSIWAKTVAWMMAGLHRRKFKKHMQYKLAFTLIVVMLALFALAINVVRISQSDGQDYAVEVLSQYKYSSGTIQARRGDIVDRNGTRIATSEQEYIMILDPKVILFNTDNMRKTVQTVSLFFDADADDLQQRLEAHSTSNYLRYLENGKAKYFSYEQVENFKSAVEEINAIAGKDNPGTVEGIWFELSYSRTYPFADSGCKVIGFTSSDSSKGLWGIENEYNEQLTGENGRYLGYMNDDYKLERTVFDAKNGNTVVSTIDMSAQAILEANIDVFMEQTGGENVGVVLMDPNNGEILAMATNKRYNLNTPGDLSAYYSEEDYQSWDEGRDIPLLRKYFNYNDEKLDPLSQEERLALRNDIWRNDIWRNFCLNDSYEPGSTAKTITIAAGVEENILHGNEEYYCQGYEMRGGWMIHCNHREGHGQLTLKQSLDYSCNAALMQIGSALGPNIMSKYLQIFGYGQFTGIDLPGEASCEGLLYTADRMGEAELATTAFGQSYNITMMQQVAAYASIINGGYYYEPHVVKEIRDEKGAVIETVAPTLVRQTISEETSAVMRDMLLDVVENGTGSYAKIPGYLIGGKTGASEKLPRGTGDYVISFISYTSPEDPQLLLYVVIDTPHIEDQSSSAQAQFLARACWEDLLPYYNIFADPSLVEEGEEAGVENHNPYLDDSFFNGVIIEEPTPEDIEAAAAAAAQGEIDRGEVVPEPAPEPEPAAEPAPEA